MNYRLQSLYVTIFLFCFKLMAAQDSIYDPLKEFSDISIGEKVAITKWLRLSSQDEIDSSLLSEIKPKVVQHPDAVAHAVNLWMQDIRKSSSDLTQYLRILDIMYPELYPAIIHLGFRLSSQEKRPPIADFAACWGRFLVDTEDQDSIVVKLPYEYSMNWNKLVVTTAIRVNYGLSVSIQEQEKWANLMKSSDEGTGCFNTAKNRAILESFLENARSGKRIKFKDIPFNWCAYFL